MVRAADPDQEHIAFMLDGGTRGMIEQLVESADAWGFGGSLWIAKNSAHYKVGPVDTTSGAIFDLSQDTHFEKTWFETEAGPTGWAIWFHAPGLPLRGRMLCGWVPAAREADVARWLSFLNAEIAARVSEAGRPPEAMTPEARLGASIAAIRRLGVPIPDANNIDDFVTRLENASPDGPVDARTRPGQRGVGAEWLSVTMGASHGPNGWVGADRMRISVDGHVELDNQRGDRHHHFAARLATAALQQLQAALVDALFENRPPLGQLVPDTTVVTLTLTSAAGQPRTIEVDYHRALAAPDIGPLVRFVERLAKHLRDPARNPDANIATIVEEDADWS
jgi:hypothetical protein